MAGRRAAEVVASPDLDVIVDTHAHLDDPAFDVDRDAVVDRAREAGVAAIVNVGYDEARWASTLHLAGRHAAVYAALGVHPHEAAAWDAALGGRLRRALGAAKVVALGEIGLDFYRDYAPREAQRAAFTAQLALARELDLPVVLHSRAAEDEVVAALAEHRV
ncbi:MAG TPA: TatD family hydrolase, partial [Thermomicrobiales bacterium]|nr:TatD family hydrolase [Thermomicrobiales bacterium]